LTFQINTKPRIKSYEEYTVPTI